MDALQLLTHPVEILALIKYRLVGCAAVNSSFDLYSLDPDVQTCYAFLKQTSRSFYAVIMALDDELRFAVCIFYLVLRALDTVEDDMTIPINEKIPLLEAFHEKLYIVGWNYTKSQEKDRMVLEQFHVISSEFRKLKPDFRDVISQSCFQMGRGMISFLNGRTVDTFDEWDEYCHHVAGLVGIGLSKLFTASGLESDSVGTNEKLSNSMGLFLQKTNIIRDYLEDVKQNRIFWPKQAWSKYAKRPHDFIKPENLSNALTCLNELISNALQHIPDVLEYMGQIHNQSVFNFCAIPQVMAIATLERCYNNPAVFRKNVKIRKGEAVILMNRATSMGAVREILGEYCLMILSRTEPNNSVGENTRSIIRQSFGDKIHPVSGLTVGTIDLLIFLSVGLIFWKYWTIRKLTN